MFHYSNQILPSDKSTALCLILRLQRGNSICGNDCLKAIIKLIISLHCIFVLVYQTWSCRVCLSATADSCAFASNFLWINFTRVWLRKIKDDKNWRGCGQVSKGLIKHCKKATSTTSCLLLSRHRVQNYRNFLYSISISRPVAFAITQTSWLASLICSPPD